MPHRHLSNPIAELIRDYAMEKSRQWRDKDRAGDVEHNFLRGLANYHLRVIEKRKQIELAVLKIPTPLGGAPAALLASRLFGAQISDSYTESPCSSSKPAENPPSVMGAEEVMVDYLRELELLRDMIATREKSTNASPDGPKVPVFFFDFDEFRPLIDIAEITDVKERADRLAQMWQDHDDRMWETARATIEEVERIMPELSMSRSMFAGRESRLTSLHLHRRPSLGERCAFTLIEISIVLVVIGLVVGGVLVGKDMIESATTRRVISELDSYRTAAVTFKLKYNAIPGDMANATQFWGTISGDCVTTAGNGTETCNGNGDGVIDYLVTPAGGWIPKHESWRATQQLALAGVVPGTYTGVAITPCSLTNYCAKPGVNMPPSIIAGAGWFFSSPDTPGTSWAGKATYRNFVSLANPGNHPSRWWFGPSLTSFQMATIDTKIDDGKPFTGKITEMSDSLYTPECTDLDNFTDTSAAYDLNVFTTACIMFADLGL